MKWSKSPAALVALFTQATSRLSDVERRQMFGYPAVFAGGHMFAGLFQDRMILRLPDAERVAFTKVYGARPFEPMPGRVMREYVEVPAEVMASGRALGAALAKGRDYAASLPRKAKPAAARRPARTAASARPSTPTSASSGPRGRKSSRR